MLIVCIIGLGGISSANPCTQPIVRKLYSKPQGKGKGKGPQR